MSNVKTTFTFAAKDNVSATLKKIETQASKTYNKAAKKALIYKRATDKAAIATAKLDTTMKSLRGSSSGLGRSLRTLGPLLAATFGVRKFLQVGIAMEKTQAAFSSLLGGDAAGSNMVEQINEFANVTPFMNSQLMRSAEMMLGFGIAQKKIMPNLKMLGAISMGNADRLRSLSLAFSQMSALGRLMGQDLNQMVNAGFNPLSIMAEETGMSMRFLRKEMERGKITADMVTEAMLKATGAGGRFDGALAKIQNTVGGKFSTVMGKLELKMIALFNKAAPSMNKFLDFFDKNMKKIIKTIGTLLKLFAIFKLSVIGAKVWMIGGAVIAKLYTLSMVALSGGVQAVIASFTKLNMVMKANIFSLATTAIAGIVMWIMKLRKETDLTKEAVIAMDEAMSNAWDINPIKNISFALNRMTNNLKGIFRATGGLVDSPISSLLESGKGEIANMLSNLGSRTPDELTDIESRLREYKNVFQRSLFHDKNLSKLQRSSTNEMITTLTNAISALQTEQSRFDKIDSGGILGDEGVSLSSSRIAKNLTINIGEVVGENGITINATTLGEGLGDMKVQIEEVFRDIALGMGQL
jgi:tape measure domain-containing protein